MKRRYDVLVFKLARQRLTARQTFFIILAVFVGPFWVFNLENYLEEKGLHRFLIEWEEPVSTVVIGVIDFLASDIALGFVIGGVIASFWGTIRDGAARILRKGRANEARKVEWEKADQDLKRLLSNMAAMSHELYLCRFDIGLDKEINNDRLNDLLEKVRDDARFVYFNEGIRLLMTGYIVACEQQIYIENYYSKMKKAGGAIHRSELAVADEFLEKAPVEFARLLWIEANHLQSVLSDTRQR